MNASPPAASGLGPVERFKPTSGQFLGWAGLVIAAVAMVWPLVESPGLTGLRIALGAAFGGVLVWATQLRPRAVAYPGRLVLRNALRDTAIPLHMVEDVEPRSSLLVHAGGERHVCIGIGQSVREELRTRRQRVRQSSNLGTSRWQQFQEMAEKAGTDERATSYPRFVANRIEQLADEARRDRDPEQDGTEVRRTWAWPEVGALAVLGAAFLASLLL